METRPIDSADDEAPAKRLAIVVEEPLRFLMDTGKFEQLQRLAHLMSVTKTVPDHLKNSIGDSFRVCAQAFRWGLDPWAICDQTFVVGGKLAYSGQLIAAVINSRAGLSGRLSYTYWGDISNQKTFGVTVSGTFIGEDEPRTVDVSWESGYAMSKGARDKWISQPEQMLAYFGSRVWARRHAPEVVMGAYTPEELVSEERRAEHAVDITPAPIGTADRLDRLEALLAKARPSPSDTKYGQPAEQPQPEASAIPAEMTKSVSGETDGEIDRMEDNLRDAPLRVRQMPVMGALLTPDESPHSGDDQFPEFAATEQPPLPMPPDADEFWSRRSYLIVVPLLTGGKYRDWKSYADEMARWIDAAPNTDSLAKLMADNADNLRMFKASAGQLAGEVKAVYNTKAKLLSG